jgi:hypothetical protein
VDAVEVRGARASVGVVLDRGVVDERVAAAERVADPVRGGADAGVVGDVELPRDDAGGFAAARPRCASRAPRTTR